MPDSRVAHPPRLGTSSTAQAYPVAPDLVERLAETFRVLGDPTRVRIISALAGSELCVRELTDALEMNQSAVSHQLRVLRHLRLVRSQKRGRQVYYALDDVHIEQIFQRGLEHVEHAYK